MKSRYVLGLLMGLFVLVGCDDSENDPTGTRDAGIVPIISELNPAIFIDGQLGSSFIEFTVSLSENDKVDEAYVVVSLNGIEERLRIEEISEFPAVLNFTAVETMAVLGLVEDDLKGGDFFLFEVITRKGDVFSRSAASVSILVACPSSIAGVYALEAKGSGGNGLGPASPWETKVETIEIKEKDGGVTYTIEPALGGLMVDYYTDYGATTVVGEIQDICGTITNAVVNDGWGMVSYSGSIDEESGVISINFENQWGDKAVMTLTPIFE